MPERSHYELPVQAHCSDMRPTRHRFIPPRNREGGWGKPDLGTAYWTSTYSTLEDDGWVGWGRRERYSNPKRAWLLTPEPAHVFEVHDKRDVDLLHHDFGIGYPDPPFKHAGLDWEALAREFDAVRLTNPYADGIRFHESNMTFYGWDCESTCWLRWCFRDEPQLVDLTPYEYPCWECYNDPCTCEIGLIR